MKKFKIIFATVVLCIVTYGGFQVSEHPRTVVSEVLLLENVEALSSMAETEKVKNCYTSISDTTTDSGSELISYRYCGTCDNKLGTSASRDKDDTCTEK